MKVLVFVTQFYRLGGAEGLQIDLARRLNARGVRADVLGLYRADDPGVPEVARKLRVDGVSRVDFLGLVPHPSTLSLIGAVWRLRRLVAREGYDVVETSGPTPSAIAMLALQGTKTRHVAGLHQVCRTDRDTNSSLRGLRFLASLDRRVRYYGVSKAAADAWVRFGRVDASRVRVIHNAIADEFFGAPIDREKAREVLAVPRGATVVLYVGRLARYKGIGTAFDALLPIIAKRNVVLLYVGDVDQDVLGSAEEVVALQATVRQSGLTDRVRWLGQRADVSEIMKAADLLIHPTSIEAFGLVLVEALAAGVPIVSTGIEGIPDILDGTGSILVQPGDVSALREAVEAALGRSPEEKESVRSRGRQRAEQFRAEQRVSTMLQYFAESPTV